VSITYDAYHTEHNAICRQHWNEKEEAMESSAL